VILVETSMAGNLGAAMRVAANFSVPRLDLVRCKVDPEDAEVLKWACGGDRLLDVRHHSTLSDAGEEYRTLIATASARGRDSHPVVTPVEAVEEIRQRGVASTALVFGNETSGLCRQDLDRCDLTVRVPTDPTFPVLNVTQAVAIVLGYLSVTVEPAEPTGPEPAPHVQVEGLINHLRTSLLAIGYLDPVNPDRILRKLRHLIGRAGITENEVGILRGICRQMEWAARTGPLSDRQGECEGNQSARQPG
jgi:TrmH family RNA methyltransferase